MKKLTILFCVFILFEPVSHAQITFNRTYDAIGSETLFNILPIDSGYVMVMNVNQSPDKYQISFLNNFGDTTLTKIYETPSGSTTVYSVIQTNDSNFVTGCFYQDLSINVRKLFIVKFNYLGDTMWSKVISAPNGFEYFGRYLIETSDHGFLFTGALVDLGWLNSEFFILKTDSMGNFEWVNTFGGAFYDDAFSSIETPDKGFLTIGLTRSFGFGNSSNRDDLLVKWDSVGNFQWHKTFGTVEDDYAIGISNCIDGNYILNSIKYNSLTTSENGKLIKIDVDGNLIWQQFFASKSSFWWHEELSNTNIALVGSARQSTNFDDGLIIITDSSGNQLWRRHYRFGNSHCYFRDIQETFDGGIICAGFVFNGDSGGQDGWLVKLDSTGCLSNGCGEPTGLFEPAVSSNFQMSVSPNPVVEEAIVKISGLDQELINENFVVNVFDISGKLVATPRTGFLISESDIQFIFKRGLLESGIYLLEVITENNIHLGIVKMYIE